MKTILAAGAAAIALGVAGTAHAQAKAEDLMKANGCATCHAVGEKKVGPSFKDIAAKYKGKADAEKALVAQLKDGYDAYRAFLEAAPQGHGVLRTPLGHSRVKVAPSPWELELLGGPTAGAVAARTPMALAS